MSEQKQERTPQTGGERNEMRIRFDSYSVN